MNGFPRSLRTSRAAISAATARRLILPPFGLLRASNFARGYGLGASLGEALAALALSVRYPLPLAGRRQLRDGSRFLEVYDDTSNPSA